MNGGCMSDFGIAFPKKNFAVRDLSIPIHRDGKVKYFCKKFNNMKFKIGDKVKFLNDHGGGVVSKVVTSNLVHVKIEDGFEIPTLTNELVLVQDTSMFGGHQSEVFSVPQQNRPAPPPEPEEVIYDERSSRLDVFKAKGEDKKGIYLAYVPQDQRWLLTGLLDIYLINYTEYDVLFSMFLRKQNGAWEGADYDAMKPNTKILLATIEREEIEKWSYGVLQAMYHRDASAKVLAPVNSTFSIKPAKLFRENSYLDSSFLNDKSFLFLINEVGIQPAVAESELDEKYDEEVAMQHAKPKQPEEVINKHKTGPREAVVDLHIGELTDDYSKMTNVDMLNFQLNYFVRCLESAIKGYLTKVTFIHGVGEGVLKNRMMEILKQYDHVQSRDASLKNFGYGATEVLIWHSSFA